MHSSHHKNSYFSAREERTICISIGRLPTTESTGKVELFNMNTTTDGLTFSGCNTGQRTDIRYCPGHTDLAVPVLYVKVSYLTQDEWTRRRLLKGMSTNWQSEAHQFRVLIGEPVKDKKTKRVGSSWEEACRQHSGAALHIIDLQWKTFLFTLPPPVVLWQSFSECRVEEGNPFLLWRDPESGNADNLLTTDDTKEDVSAVKPPLLRRLIHHDTVRALKATKDPESAFTRTLSEKQRRILQRMTASHATQKF